MTRTFCDLCKLEAPIKRGVNKQMVEIMVGEVKVKYSLMLNIHKDLCADCFALVLQEIEITE